MPDLKLTDDITDLTDTTQTVEVTTEPSNDDAHQKDTSADNGAIADGEIAKDGPSAENPSDAKKTKKKKIWRKPTKKEVLHEIVSYLLMTVGTILVAGGVYFFKAPNHFATGGVSGLSIVLAKFVPLNQSTLVMIINVLLLIIGFIFLGKGCTVRTMYCSVMYSLENMLLERFLPIEKIPGAILNNGAYTLTNQPLMELVYAMLLTGIGSAIMFNCRASSGGTDIIALILKKFTKLNTGKALLITDAAIAVSTFFTFGVQAGLFSILGLFSKAFIVDGVIENIGKTKYITIITTAPEKIGGYILNNMKRDYTCYKATGGYTGAEKTVLITVCKRGEALKLKAVAKKLDPTSFIIITDANEILGKGFREAV
ncbi:MAG: YitT family protein [Clostridia bacterium]|nr:YitT family protein [Clostridia bacterium]